MKNRALERIARTSGFVWLLAIITASLSAQTFATLHIFDGTDGAAAPAAQLIQGIDGNLYGTTAGLIAPPGGTFFNMTPSGALTTLYSFCEINNCLSAGPHGLVQVMNGDFYGTTSSGGSGGQGTVFKITSSGSAEVLYDFASLDRADGWAPVAGLAVGLDGNFYGTTSDGGDFGAGTLFRISPDGTLVTIHTFCSKRHCADGKNPEATLVLGFDGKLYGTTAGGGANGDYGTIFNVTTDGALTTIYSFCSQSGCPDGQLPNELMQAADGRFYGTTYGVLSNGSYGTIFTMTPSGELTTLYRFCSQPACADGQNPGAALVEATDGAFYGTTAFGGVNRYCNDGETVGCGTIFSFRPQGKLTKLHDFCNESGCSDGEIPGAPLLQATNGVLYGTTVYGGVFCGGFQPDCGTLFSLSTGLGPSVKTLPHYGQPGTLIGILGTELADTVRVQFNGVSSRFTIVSATEIAALVPAGATTGQIEVTTAAGRVYKGGPFLVLHP